MNKHLYLLLSCVLGLVSTQAGCGATGIGNQRIGKAPTTEMTTNFTANSTTYLSTNSRGTQSSSGNTTPEQSAATTNLNSIQMLNPNSGWAWGYQNGNFQLLKTINGGQNWSKTSLPVQPPKSDAENGQEDPVAVHFLNEKSGWLGWINSQNSSLTLLQTRDGGQHWEQSNSPVSNGAKTVNRIDFVNSNRGWILISSAAGASGAQKFLYSTDDKGKSWNNLTSNNPFPYSGTMADINFLNSTDGWLTLGNPANSSVLLFHTMDGGKTWNNMKESVPVPQEYQKYDAISVYPPLFAKPQNKEGILLVNFYANNNNYPVIYRTEDGGKTWTPILMKGFVNATVSQSGLPAIFLNANDGWSFKAGKLYRTTNGGKTWNVIPSTTLSNTFKRYPNVGKLDFVTPQIGWMLLKSNENSQSQLLKTTNGGATWVTQ